MTDKGWSKLSVQDIHELWDSRNFDVVLDEVVRAYKAGSVFTLGVDKLRDSYCLTINTMVRGIYLRPDTEKVKQAEWFLTAIAPDVALAGTVDWREENRVIIFYVSPEEFARFWQEAEQIFREYFFKGFCFRMIPDLWFSDTSLVQYIREQLRPHPAMRSWFELDPRLVEGVDGFAVSQKFNR